MQNESIDKRQKTNGPSKFFHNIKNNNKNVSKPIITEKKKAKKKKKEKKMTCKKVAVRSPVPC